MGGRRVILLDASAVLAFTRDEPAADEVEAFLEDTTERTAISAVNLAEVVDRLIRKFGYEPDAAIAGLRLLRAGGLDVLFVDDFIAEDAGELRSRYYARAQSALSMADCIALATARREGAQVATTDTAFAGAARAEGVPLVALPDRRGNRP